MAGLGRKVFEALDVLTAADVMGYFMDQAVMVFDDSTARGTAIGTATEGMVTYLKDTNALEKYDGSSWTDVVSIPTPTITSSTATSYTIQSSDASNFLQFTAAAGTVTIGTATAFSAGQQVQILADGTATIIAGDGGVTLSGAGTAGTAVSFTAGQYEAIAVLGLGSDAYRIIGATVVE